MIKVGQVLGKGVALACSAFFFIVSLPFAFLYASIRKI